MTRTTLSTIASAMLAAWLLDAPAAEARSFHAPFKCKGDRTLVLRDKTITAAKDALELKGRCRVELINCKIVAGRHAINLRDSATVRIRRSVIEGKKSALRLGGSGDAHVQGSVLTGRVHRVGSGKLIDEGANTFGKATAEAAAPTKYRSHPPLVCKGRQKLTLRKRRIETKGDGIVVRGHCQVQLIDCQVIAGRAALVVRNDGKAVIEGGRLEGKHEAVRVVDRGDVQTRGAALMGAIVSLQKGRFRFGGGSLGGIHMSGGGKIHLGAGASIRQDAPSAPPHRLPAEALLGPLHKHAKTSCRRNADCHILMPLCEGCAPCKPAWRSVGNSAEVLRRKSMRTRIRCALPKCRSCAAEHFWLGDTPFCEHGSCRLRHRGALPPKSGKSGKSGGKPAKR